MKQIVDGPLVYSDMIVLLDTSWLLHKNWHAMKHLTFNGQVTGHYYGILRLVNSIQKHNNALVVLCLDSRPVEKHDMLDGYKEGRKGTFDLKSAAITMCKLACALPKVIAATSVDQEADDVMFTLASKMLVHTVIFSGDDDLLQTMTMPHVTVSRSYTVKGFDPVPDEYIKTKYGVPVDKLVFFRALTGDKSDNIPRLYPDKAAMLIVANYETPQLFIDALRADGSVKVEDVVRNCSMTQLKQVEVKYWKGEMVDAYSEAKKHGLNSFVKQLDKLQESSGIG